MFFPHKPLIITISWVITQLANAEIEVLQIKNGRISRTSQFQGNASAFVTDGERNQTSPSDSSKHTIQSVILRDNIPPIKKLHRKSGSENTLQQRKFSFLLDANEPTTGDTLKEEQKKTSKKITYADIQRLQNFINKLSSVSTGIIQQDLPNRTIRKTRFTSEIKQLPNMQATRTHNIYGNRKFYASNESGVLVNKQKDISLKQKILSLRPKNNVTSLSKFDVHALIGVNRTLKIMQRRTKGNDNSNKPIFVNEETDFQVMNKKSNHHAHSMPSHQILGPTEQVYISTKQSLNDVHRKGNGVKTSSKLGVKSIHATKLENMIQPVLHGQKLMETVAEAIENTTHQLLQFIKLEHQLEGMQNDTLVNENKNDIYYENKLTNFVNTMRNPKNSDSREKVKDLNVDSSRLNKNVKFEGHLNLKISNSNLPKQPFVGKNHHSTSLNLHSNKQTLIRSEGMPENSDESMQQNMLLKKKSQNQEQEEKLKHQEYNEVHTVSEEEYLKVQEANVTQAGRQVEKQEQAFIYSNKSEEKGSGEENLTRTDRKHQVNTMKQLIASLLGDTFQTWIYHQKSFEELGVTPSLLKAGIVNLGSSIAMQQVVRKAVKGKTVKMLVVGGSISAGGGLWKDRGNIDGVYHAAFSNWWRTTITPVTKSDIKVDNIAIGGADSEYFSYCINNFMNSEPDIVLWELSANDYTRFNERDVDPSIPLEQLTRIILQLPSHPALIYVNFFRGDQQNFELGEKCPDSEESEVDVLSRYYDIPSLSWKRMVCNLITKRTLIYRELFSDDGYHPNLLGHAQVAMLLTIYIKGIFKNVIANDLDNRESLDILDTFQNNDQLKIPAFKDPLNPRPSCWTLLTPDYTKVFKNTLNEVNVVQGKGFELRNVTAWDVRRDRIQCIFAAKSDALLYLTLNVPVLESETNLPLAEAQTRTLAIGIHNKFGGIAEVQLDKLPSKTSVGHNTGKLKQSRVYIVSDDVRPGVHNLRFFPLTPGFCLTSIMVI